MLVRLLILTVLHTSGKEEICTVGQSNKRFAQLSINPIKLKVNKYTENDISNVKKDMNDLDYCIPLAIERWSE